MWQRRGELRKVRVRELASPTAGLHTAAKRDSVGICFVGTAVDSSGKCSSKTVARTPTFLLAGGGGGLLT